MRRTKTVAAVCFLAILGACLLAVLAGAAGVALGWKLPVAVSPYQGEPTYSGVAEWFKDTCRAFCTTELPGREKLMEANAALNRAAGKWIFENTEPEVVRLENGYLESAGNFFYYLTRPDEAVAGFSRWGCCFFLGITGSPPFLRTRPSHPNTRCRAGRCSPYGRSGCPPAARRTSGPPAGCPRALPG